MVMAYTGAAKVILLKSVSLVLFSDSVKMFVRNALNSGCEATVSK